MKPSKRVFWVFSCAAVLLIACRPTPADIAGPETSWESMSKDERSAYMASTVVPYMKKRFVAEDPERFADFGCATCHGSGAADGSYQMPNPDLLVLSRKTFKETRKEHPEMVRFMWTHVEIEMATLLGKKTGRRKFSCRSCHTRE